MTREEITAALAEHSMFSDARGCAKMGCYGSWPCVPVRALNDALALLDLREGIETRIIVIEASLGVIADAARKEERRMCVTMLRALLTPKSTEGASDGK